MFVFEPEVREHMRRSCAVPGRVLPADVLGDVPASCDAVCSCRANGGNARQGNNRSRKKGE